MAFQAFQYGSKCLLQLSERQKAGYRKEKQKILEKIKYIYYNNNRIIGHRGMKVFLGREGIYLGKTAVHRYMDQDLGLHAVTMRKKLAYARG